MGHKLRWVRRINNDSLLALVVGNEVGIVIAAPLPWASQLSSYTAESLRHRLVWQFKMLNCSSSNAKISAYTWELIGYAFF